MATPAQIEANRRNALKATGPRTEAGKLASRRNALKHRLTGSTLLAEPDEATLAVRVAALSDEVRPRDESERWVVEEAARAAVRSERAFAEERAKVERDAARASCSWAEDQAIATEDLGARIARDPARIKLRLERSRAGCLWLAERWRSVLRDADAAGDPRFDRGVMDLRGVPRREREGEPAAIPSSAEHLRAEAAGEVERLTRRAEALSDVDALEREHAAAGVGEPGPALRRIRRYAIEAAHALRWAFTQLDRLRRDPAGQPARPEARPRADARPVEPRPQSPAEAAPPSRVGRAGDSSPAASAPRDLSPTARAALTRFLLRPTESAPLAIAAGRAPTPPGR